MNEPPVSFPNPQINVNGGLDGFIAEYLREIQASMGWTCSSMELFAKEDENGFNSFVDNLIECTNKTTGQVHQSMKCHCDIGIGGWFQTFERYGKADFVQPFAHDSFRVFTSKENTFASANRFFFFQTFDLFSWLCIFGLFVMFTSLKLLDRGFAPAAPYKPAFEKGTFARFWHYIMKSPVLYRIRKGIQSTITRMLLTTDDPVVANGKSTRQWFLNISISVCSLFLILSYEASMTASLVQESVSSNFQSIADFKMCRVQPRDVCFFRGGALEVYWKTSISLDDCHTGHSPTYVTSYDELFSLVDGAKCKFGIAMEDSIRWEMLKRPCGDLVLLGEPIWTAGLHMLLPKGSNLTTPMSLATLEFLRNTSKTGMQQDFERQGCGDDGSVTLTFWKLGLFFALVFSIGGIIFCCMLFDRFLRSKSTGKDTGPSSMV
ncbi:unnamed protein product [Agarophyton chilense]